MYNNNVILHNVILKNVFNLINQNYQYIEHENFFQRKNVQLFFGKFY